MVLFQQEKDDKIVGGTSRKIKYGHKKARHAAGSKNDYQ